MIPAIEVDVGTAVFEDPKDYLFILEPGGHGLAIFTKSVVTFGILISAIFVLYRLVDGGYTWLTAGGDSKKVEGAKSKITNAIIGIAIISAVWAISSIIISFFGAPVDIDSKVGL